LFVKFPQQNLEDPKSYLVKYLKEVNREEFEKIWKVWPYNAKMWRSRSHFIKSLNKYLDKSGADTDTKVKISRILKDLLVEYPELHTSN
jgi:hypothetical protein